MADARGAAGTVAVASTLAFGTAWIRASTVGAHESSPLGGVHWLTQLGLGHRDAVLLAAAVFLAAWLVRLRSARQTRRARLSLAATALCLTSSLLRAWYALWPVALAAYAVTGYLLFGDAVQL